MKSPELPVHFASTGVGKYLCLSISLAFMYACV